MPIGSPSGSCLSVVGLREDSFGIPLLVLYDDIVDKQGSDIYQAVRMLKKGDKYI